jgi:hypothetical protein
MLATLLNKMHSARRSTSPWDFVGRFGAGATYGPQFQQNHSSRHNRFNMTTA